MMTITMLLATMPGADPAVERAWANPKVDSVVARAWAAPTVDPNKTTPQKIAQPQIDNLVNQAWVAASASRDPAVSFVLIECGKAGGCGAVIWSDGTKSAVLTAMHVACYDQYSQPHIIIGKTRYPAKMIAYDQKADLAVVMTACVLPAASISTREPAVGDVVKLVGRTSGKSDGTILKNKDVVDYAAFLCSYPSDQGDSGGPVFCNGEIIGVHTGKFNPPDASLGQTHDPGACVTAISRIHKFLGKFKKKKTDSGVEEDVYDFSDYAAPSVLIYAQPAPPAQPTQPVAASPDPYCTGPNCSTTMPATSRKIGWRLGRR